MIDPKQDYKVETLTEAILKVLQTKEDLLAGPELQSDRWLDLGANGLLGLPFPENLGGGGFSVYDSAAVFRNLGRRSADRGSVFAAAAHLLGCTVPIWLFGSGEQHQAFLPGLTSGKFVAAHAITEEVSGSDVFGMSTTATKTEGGYIINGSKTYVTNAPGANLLVLYAVTDSSKGFYGGISAFILDKSLCNWACSERFEKIGLKRAEMGRLEFQDTFVSTSNMLGAEGSGAGIFLSAMNWERTFLSAFHAGVLERLLELTTSVIRSKARLKAHQAVTHPLADIYVELQAVLALTDQTLHALNENDKRLDLKATVAKLYSSEVLKRASMTCLQMTGAAGFSGQNEVGSIFTDASASTLYSGPSEVLRNIISKHQGL